MEIKQITTTEVTPKQLAKSLSDATPSEFAEFWFQFSELTEKNDKLMDDFAKAMAPSCGSYRKRALNKIFDLMKYYEIDSQKNSK